MKPNTIYTHDEAARILELFENVLMENGISVPSPEDDERDDDDRLGLYGSTYSDLLDSVEEILIGVCGDAASGSEVVSHEFSGTF